jgi:hypothetical protein
MADLATAKYLDENVGPALAKGLAEVSTAQPADAIAFLAQWLKQHADTEDANAKRAMEQQLLEEERAKKRAEQKAKEAKIQKKKDELAAIDKARDDLLARLEAATEWTDSFWTELLQVSQRITGAKGVYIGVHEDFGEGNSAICYEYASTEPDQSWMTEKKLEQGKGVTWGVFEKEPTDDRAKELNLFKPPAPEGAPAEEGAPPAGPPYCPVYIECVTDNPDMVYFDMTRLGSYMACPIVYSSYYSPEALKAATDYENEKAEQERIAAEKAEAAEAAGEEAGEEEVPAEPVPEIVMKLPGSDMKMVLCMDSLGTNTAFDTAKIPDLQSLCSAAAACKTRAEEKQVDEQAIFMLNQAKREEVENLYIGYVKEASDSVQDQNEKDKAELAELLAGEPGENVQVLEEVLGKSVGEAKGDLLEKKYAFYKARDVVERMKEYIMELTSWVVVGNEMKSIIAAAALLLGFRKDSVYMRKKDGLHWEKLVELLAPALFDTISKVDVAGVRKELQDEQKLAFIKTYAYPGEFSEQNAEELSPAFKALFVYVRAAFEYRYADVKFRKAELDAKEKAAAEAEEGAAAPEVDPAELDDDFADINNIVI